MKIDGTNADEELEGTSGADTINGKGGDDEIRGLNGNDALAGDNFLGPHGDDEMYGGNGKDELYGQAGDDELYGGKGNDYLAGRDDDDRLAGNLGADELFGGEGFDVFVYEKIQDSQPGAGKYDFVRDLDLAYDQFDLDQIDANTGQNGNQDFTSIAEGDPDFDAPGQIAFKSNHGYTTVWLNVDADEAAEGMIQVEGVHDFSIFDFS